MGQFGLFGFAISAVIVALAGSLLFYLSYLQSEQIRKNEFKTAAVGHAAKLSNLVKHYAATIDRWIEAPGLAPLIASGEPQTLAQKEQELSWLLPLSLRVRLLPPGIEDVDESSEPPLSFAGLELLRRAATSDQPPDAEVHLLGTPQQHFNIARRVVGEDGELAGFVLASFPLKLLQDTVSSGALAEGYLELHQTIDDGIPVVLASLGVPDQSNSQPLGEVPIPGTLWQLLYWPVQSDRGFGSVMVFAIVIAVSILLLALVNFSVFNRLKEALRNDQATVINLVEDMVNGDLRRDYPVHIANCHGTVELLMGIAKEFSSTEHARPQTELALTQAAGEDLSPENELEVETIGRVQGEGKAPAAIFRAYDIRGVVGETLTPEIVYEIGRAIGSEAHDQEQQSIIVARDGQESGPAFLDALSRGLEATGRDVIDIGMVPTPVMYFATHYLNSNSGVMITGSHNAADYNGIKVVLNGDTLYGESIQALRRRIDTGHLVTGEGTRQSHGIVTDYIGRILGDVPLARPLKVAVDCGNGVAGEIAPDLLSGLGCEVIELFCEVDGSFPNHHPNPSRPENLKSLIQVVREQAADVGIAFDGDGDRLVVIDSKGDIIWPDRLLMLFAKDVLSRQPGAEIIYDIKCSRHLPRAIAQYGGHPHMWKTGHSLIKARLNETDAALAGEFSGHILFKERWYGFDDALYASARLLEILSADRRPSHDVFAEFPNSINTPELEIGMAEGQHFRFMERLLAKAQFPGAKLTTLDGLRADFEDAWGLVRASNTTPSLVLRFEADNKDALRRIQNEFRNVLLELDPGLLIPF